MSAGLEVKLLVARVRVRDIECWRCEAKPLEPCRKVYGCDAKAAFQGQTVLVLGAPLAYYHKERAERAREIRATGGVRA